MFGDRKFLDWKDRTELYEKFIKGVELKDVPPATAAELKDGENVHYIGNSVHEAFLNHVQQFFFEESLILTQGGKLKIGYSAFHGSGINAVPRLLTESGFKDVQIIRTLSEINGFFPPLPSIRTSSPIRATKLRRKQP